MNCCLNNNKNNICVLFQGYNGQRSAFAIRWLRLRRGISYSYWLRCPSSVSGQLRIYRFQFKLITLCSVMCKFHLYTNFILARVWKAVVIAHVRSAHISTKSSKPQSPSITGQVITACPQRRNIYQSSLYGGAAVVGHLIIGRLLF